MAEFLRGDEENTSEWHNRLIDRLFGQLENVRNDVDANKSDDSDLTSEE